MTNSLIEVEALARSLMTEHGVGYLAFAFDGGKRRIGQTNFTRHAADAPWIPKNITLSRRFAAIMPMDEIREVMLHEIAHAKAGIEVDADGNDVHHGNKWKREARLLGIAATRCYETSVTIESPITGFCPKCKKTIAGPHRLPLRVKYHNGCGFSDPVRWSKHGVEIPWHKMPTRYVNEYARKHNGGIFFTTFS